MTNRNLHRNHRATLFALAALLLSACTAATNAASSDDSMSRFLVAPGKYVLFSCPALAVVTKTSTERLHALEALMAKAETTSSGRLVSALSYRPEYVSVQGDLREQHAAAVEKNCVKGAGNPSGRATGTRPAPPARASDTFIR